MKRNHRRHRSQRASNRVNISIVDELTRQEYERLSNENAAGKRTLENTFEALDSAKEMPAILTEKEAGR